MQNEKNFLLPMHLENDLFAIHCYITTSLHHSFSLIILEISSQCVHVHEKNCHKNVDDDLKYSCKFLEKACIKSKVAASCLQSFNKFRTNLKQVASIHLIPIKPGTLIIQDKEQMMIHERIMLDKQIYHCISKTVEKE